MISQQNCDANDEEKNLKEELKQYNMKLDPMLRAEIIATVRETVREVLEGADEKWVTPKELASQISFLPIEWIRHNGELLPRECAIVMVDGEPKKTNDGYPLHKIQRMIREGKLKNLVKGTKN